MKRTIIYIILCAMASAGCERFPVEEVLLQREDISLSLKGEVLMQYTPDTWQLSYNAVKNEFRIHDDRMANFFSLKCDSKPSHEGQELKATLQYTTASSTRTENNLSLTVERIDGQGQIWMWNRSKKFGIIVRELQ